MLNIRADDVESDEGELLVVQRTFLEDLKNKESWKRELFHTQCTSHGKVCLVIVDSRSCTNVILEEMTTKFGLKIERHPKPYKLH